MSWSKEVIAHLAVTKNRFYTVDENRIQENEVFLIDQMGSVIKAVREGIKVYLYKLDDLEPVGLIGSMELISEEIDEKLAMNIRVLDNMLLFFDQLEVDYPDMNQEIECVISAMGILVKCLNKE